MIDASRFILAALALLVALPLSAQELGEWERIPNVPGADFHNVWAGDSIVAAQYGVGQRLLISRDYGVTWEEKDVAVEQLHIGDDGVVVALTSDLWIVRSDDYGATFTPVDTAWGHSSGRDQYRLFGRGDDVYLTVRRVFMTNPTTDLKVLFGSHDGGATWEELPYPALPVFRLLISPQGDLLAASSTADVLLRFDDDLFDWEEAAALPDSIERIQYGRDDRLYAATRLGSFYRSDIGALALSPFPLSFRLSGAVDFEVTSDGEILGGPAVQDPPRIIRISAAGDSVGVLPLRVHPHKPDGYPDLVLGEGDRIFGAYSGSHAFSMWLTDEESGLLPLDYAGHAHVHALEPSFGAEYLVLTAGHAYLGDPATDRYEQLGIGYGNAFALFFADSITLAHYAFGLTSDKGRTWTRVEEGMGLRHARDGRGNLYTGPSLRAKRSTDGGRTWEEIEGVSPSMAVAARDSTVVIIGGKWAYFSSDYGETWREIDVTSGAVRLSNGIVTPAGTYIGAERYDIDSINSTYGIVRPGDSVPTPYDLPCGDSFPYWFLSDPAGRPHLAASCGIFRSDDDGMTWIKLGDYPDGVTPTALLITKDGTFYLGTTDGLYRTTRVSSVPSLPTVAPGADATLRLLSASGDASTILLDLPTATRVTIALYDLEGRRVAMIHDGEMAGGEHALTMTMPGGIAAGAYLLVMRTGEGGVGAIGIDVGGD